MYTCASCQIHACVSGDKEKMPKNCPMHNEELMERAKAEYAKPEYRDFYKNSCLVESEGYCQWPRVKEIAEFCKKNGFTKIGVAFCTGLRQEGKVACEIFRNHGLEVVSVMCNPVAQAMLLNEQNTQFNVVIGLCVGHDSMFYKYSEAMCTTLVTKDRVLAHNPAGALYCAGSYFKTRV